MSDSGWAFVRRAGTLILATMVLVWALLYFPRGRRRGEAYEVRIAHLKARTAELEQRIEQCAGRPNKGSSRRRRKN